MRDSTANVRRIVAIRPGALGDTLLLFPALALLRRAGPEAHITLVARRDALPLARAWGLADAVSAYDAPEWSALFATVPPTESSLRVTLAGSAVVAWLTDTDGLVATNMRALGAGVIVIAPGRPREDIQLHAALQLAAPLAGLGVAVPADTSALYAALPLLHLTSLENTTKTLPAAPSFSSVDLRSLRFLRVEPRFPLSAPGGRPHDTSRQENGLVAIHAGSGGAAKRWPPERFAALAGEICGWGLHPVLIEGPQDSDITGAILAEAAHLSIELAVARELDILALAYMLAGCTAYVGNDSGVSHLAGLLGLPTLAVFGPTDPAIWSPLSPHVHALRSPTGALANLPLATVASALRALLPSPRGERGRG